VADAIDVLGIEREAFGAFELAFSEAYNAGGVDQASSLRLRDPQGQRIVLWRFLGHGIRLPERMPNGPLKRPRNGLEALETKTPGLSMRKIWSG
jgi:hypothetical protein